jgi:rod shape-determining protein MreD
MTRSLYLIFLFFFYLFLQVIILNKILLFGYVNPYLYISFVFFYPLKKNRFLFLFLSFLLGLCIDFFSDTGGIHAFSTLFIAYIRLPLIHFLFKKTPIDYTLFKLELEQVGQIFNFVVTLTLIHHLLLFSFTNFSYQNFDRVLINTIFSSILTLLLFFLVSYIFRKKR